MVYRAKNIPAELDMLDSPLLSPTPMGSAALGTIPGSALAERIFNDPSAWGSPGGDDDGDMFNNFSSFHHGSMTLAAGKDDPMAWFSEEMEKFRMNSAGSTVVDSASTDASGSSVAGSGKSLFGAREHLMGFGRHHSRPISLVSLFERTAGDDSLHHLQRQSRHFPKNLDLRPQTAMEITGDVFSPASTTTSGSSDASSAPVDITDFICPAPIYSASTTLSFLDLYLESPNGKTGALRKSLYAKQRPRTPLLQIAQPNSRTERPISMSLFSPLGSVDDMMLSVEPLKRGSSVPPLSQVAFQISAAASDASNSVPQAAPNKPTEAPTQEVQDLARPPGLEQAGADTSSEDVTSSSEEASAQVGPTTTATSTSAASRSDKATSSTSTGSSTSSTPNSKVTTPARKVSSSLQGSETRTPPRMNRGSPPRSLPRPVLLPPYAREGSPPIGPRVPSSSSTTSSAVSASTASTPSATPSATPAGTPVRRLPTIPPTSAMAKTPMTSRTPSTSSSSSSAATPSSVTSARSGSPLPLPSSLLSPEPPMANSPLGLGALSARPLSAVRSPLGGPMGPRTRAGPAATVRVSPGRGERAATPVKRAVVAQRRPPVLHL